MAMLGFRPLPVFNAVSGDHMTATSNAREWMSLEPYPVHIMVDITHTVADVESVLRSMFSNPWITVTMPKPEDPSLPIRAMMKNEVQGLYIYLPSQPGEFPPPQDQYPPPRSVRYPAPSLRDRTALDPRTLRDTLELDDIGIVGVGCETSGGGRWRRFARRIIFLVGLD
jgi:hypothetical protein